MAKSGRRRVKKNDLERLLEFAKSVAKKADTEDELSVRQSIKKLWPGIASMLGKGYSFIDVARWLVENGVNASVDTVREAIGEEARLRRGNSAKGTSPASPASAGRRARSSAVVAPSVTVPPGRPAVPRLAASPAPRVPVPAAAAPPATASDGSDVVSADLADLPGWLRKGSSSPAHREV
jgi:hypothetical protein